MVAGLIATKVGMSRVFLESGEAVAVTYLHIEPQTIIRTKTKEKDGYDAVVLGVGGKKRTTKNGKEVTSFASVKEWKVASLEGLEAGKTVSLEEISPQTFVSVTGISKGKGFQGVIRRHHMKGGPASHGSHFKREPGSIGMREHPGKVLKGKRLPGHMGTETVTVRHRPVVAADLEKRLLAVKGPVPGPNGARIYLTIESSPSP